jgi:hypothetical protein
MNWILNFLLSYVYPYIFDIFSSFQTYSIAIIFATIYIVSHRAYQLSKTNPLPFQKAFIVKSVYYFYRLLATYYLVTLATTLIIFLLAYETERVDSFSIDIYIHQTIVFFIFLFGSMIAEKHILGRVIEQNIVNPLNQISNYFNAIKSGKKEYNPDVKRTHSGEYDPRKYFKQGQLFHGLDDRRKPVYTDLRASLDGHICITGGSGAGKGVLTRTYLSQFISYGLSNVVFDVKPDKYLFNLCAEECKRTNKEMYVIDIDVRKPQIQLFAGLNELDFETILVSAIELESQKQTNARVYAQKTEKALIEISEKLYRQGMTPKEIIKACDTHNTNLLAENQDLEALFRNLSRYKVFNSKKAPTIQQILNQNAVLYIRGASAKENMASSLILRLLFQTITKEVQYNDLQTSIFLDEFKFIMTTAVINQLATIRDFNTTLMVNFQAFSNFETSPNKAMNNKAYGRELLDNMHIFALGNTSDMETIEIVQKKGGQTIYDRAFEVEEADLGGASVTSSERRYTKHTDYKLTQNEISNGAKNTMILLAPALFKDKEFEKISTHYIKTDNYQFGISSTYQEDIVENIPKKEVEEAKIENQTIETPKKDLFADE